MRFCHAFLEVSGTQGNALQKRRPFFSRCKRRRFSTPLQMPGGYRTGSKYFYKPFVFLLNNLFF
jgi:hypothetical protein